MKKGERGIDQGVAEEAGGGSDRALGVTIGVCIIFWG